MMLRGILAMMLLELLQAMITRGGSGGGNTRRWLSLNPS